MLRHSLLLLVVVVSSTGCKPPPDPVSAPDADARPPTVIDDQLQALEKARAVQATLDQQAADREKAIKESGG